MFDDIIREDIVDAFFLKGKRSQVGLAKMFRVNVDERIDIDEAVIEKLRARS